MNKNTIVKSKEVFFFVEPIIMSVTVFFTASFEFDPVFFALPHAFYCCPISAIENSNLYERLIRERVPPTQSIVQISR